MHLQWTGLSLAAAIFITIAAGHHLVRWANFHFGTRPALPLFITGASIMAVSLFVQSTLVSALLGIAGLTTAVDGFEIIRQEKRAVKGHAKRNPARRYPEK